MQFEHIHPQIVHKRETDPATRNLLELRMPMRDVQAWWLHFPGTRIAKTPFDADEWLKSSSSGVRITVNTDTAIDAKPDLYRPGPMRLEWARPARHRTPTLFLQQNTPHPRKPLTIWTWSHFPDDYNNTQLFKSGVEDLTVMSDVELVTDFSHQVRKRYRRGFCSACTSQRACKTSLRCGHNVGASCACALSLQAAMFASWAAHIDSTAPCAGPRRAEVHAASMPLVHELVPLVPGGAAICRRVQLHSIVQRPSPPADVVLAWLPRLPL